MENPPNPIRLDENPGIADSVHVALGIDLIRDTILEYAIHDGKDVETSAICSFRQVNQAFLQSTHRILRKSKQLLFPIYLLKKGFTVGNHCSQKHQNLCNFLRLPTGNEGWTSTASPHTMEISEDFFCPQNHQIFFDYLTACGSCLIELTLNIPTSKDANIVIPLDNNFVLPKLETFFAMITPGENREHVGTIQKNLEFVQRVLHSSEQLDLLVLVCTTKACLAPHIFANMRLPSSLTAIKIQCEDSDKSLEMLVNNSLPNLKTLVLYIDDTPFTDGLITSILKKFGRTLETFHVAEKNQPSVRRRRTKFQLPLMDKLQKLLIETAHLELEGNVSCLQKRVPVLRLIVLTHETNSMFRKWTDQSCFTSVEALDVSFVPDDNFNNWNERLDEFNRANLELRTMESLARAFPNLTDLSIRFHVTGTELSSLVPLMREMRTLEKLLISVEDDGQMVDSNAWDAILIGVPAEHVVELKKHPDVLEELQADCACSIRNLSELHTLHLESTYPHEFPIISEAVFLFAFFGMPKLKKLIFKGCFYTCDMIKKDWEQQGRKLILSDGSQEYDDVFEDDVGFNSN